MLGWRMPTRPLLLACLGLALSPVCFGADYTLNASPATVAWGYYSAKAKPVLTIHSGDTVRVETSCACPLPERLEELLDQAGLKPADIPQFYRDVHEKVTDKGPGGHILTGPIAVEEAEP